MAVVVVAHNESAAAGHSHPFPETNPESNERLSVLHIASAVGAESHPWGACRTRKRARACDDESSRISVKDVSAAVPALGKGVTHPVWKPAFDKLPPTVQSLAKGTSLDLYPHDGVGQLAPDQETVAMVQVLLSTQLLAVTELLSWHIGAEACYQ